MSGRSFLAPGPTSQVDGDSISQTLVWVDTLFTRDRPFPLVGTRCSCGPKSRSLEFVLTRIRNSSSLRRFITTGRHRSQSSSGSTRIRPLQPISSRKSGLTWPWSHRLGHGGLWGRGISRVLERLPSSLSTGPSGRGLSGSRGRHRTNSGGVLLPIRFVSGRGQPTLSTARYLGSGATRAGPRTTNQLRTLSLTRHSSRQITIHVRVQHQLRPDKQLVAPYHSANRSTGIDSLFRLARIRLRCTWTGTRLCARPFTWKTQPAKKYVWSQATATPHRDTTSSKQWLRAARTITCESKSHHAMSFSRGTQARACSNTFPQSTTQWWRSRRMSYPGGTP